MKILFVCDVLGELNNGTSIAATNVMNFLKSRGHEIRILCCDQDRIGQQGYYVCPVFNAGPFNSYVAKNGVTLARKNKEVIKQAFKGIDICHVMMPLTLGKYCAKYAHDHHIPLTAGFHCQAENVSNHFFVMNVKFANKALYKNFYKKVYRYCDAIHYPTEFIRDTFESIVGKTPAHVISNGVKAEFKPHKVEKEEQYKDKFCILFTGRLSKEKCHKLLIEGVKLSKHEKDIQLFFAGEGPLQEKLEEEGAALTNKPVFGFYTRDELVKLINSCDLYCHPAEIEIEAISCMEAISCGLVPVINDSKRSAVSKFALSDKNLFKDGDPSNLAKKIDYWIEHPEEKEKCSELYKNFTSKFDFEDCMEEMEKMFLDVIESKKKNN